MLLPSACGLGLRAQEGGADSLIVISKEDMTLRLIDGQGQVLQQYPIACGKNYGNKQKPGDMKTPEGVFSISEIVDASSWTHDFGDGKGEIAGAYGPYFIRLVTPGHRGIGIHGTHKPESIGTRDTEGCIRLHNEDLQQLVGNVRVGMTVVILPSWRDALAGQ
ncbi:MAG: L,D-transpeptidase [Candidatus Cryptobacteroides sp.]